MWMLSPTKHQSHTTLLTNCTLTHKQCKTPYQQVIKTNTPAIHLTNKQDGHINTDKMPCQQVIKTNMNTYKTLYQQDEHTDGNTNTCIESLIGWMYRNKLKLNAEKTEVLPVASTSRLSSVGRDSVNIGGKRIPFRSSVRNLGVHLDQTLSMQQQFSSVCRAAYLELRRIASIRPYLTQSATAQLVSSAITSRQDYP